MPIGQDWLATAIFAGFVLIVVFVWEFLVARRFDRFAGHRRVFYALGAALGSAQFAVIALFGPDQLIASTFGETAALIMHW